MMNSGNGSNNTGSNASRQGEDWESPADSNASEQQLFALLELAETQNAAVQAGLEGLASEHEALAAERIALSQQATALEQLCKELNKAAIGALPQMAQVSAKASTEAVKAALDNVAKSASLAAAEAARPTVDSLDAAVESAAAVQRQLGKAVSDFGRKWAWLGVSVVSGAVAIAALASYGAVWWQRQELAALAVQRQQLAAEVSALQAEAERARAEQARRGSGRRPTR